MSNVANTSEDRFFNELCRLLNTKSLDRSKTLAELGWDSMVVVELAVAAEVVFDQRINLDRLNVDFDMTLDKVLSLVRDAVEDRSSTELRTSPA